MRSNSRLPIQPKTPSRVVNIARAKMNRSYSLDKASWTNFWECIGEERKIFLERKFQHDEEEGLLVSWLNEDNWTLLTSHTLFGKFNETEAKATIKQIKTYDFGIVKGMIGGPKELKVKMKWGTKTFIYESNGAGFYLMAGLDVLHTHWERGALRW